MKFFSCFYHNICSLCIQLCSHSWVTGIFHLLRSMNSEFLYYLLCAYILLYIIVQHQISKGGLHLLSLCSFMLLTFFNLSCLCYLTLCYFEFKFLTISNRVISIGKVSVLEIQNSLRNACIFSSDNLHTSRTRCSCVHVEMRIHCQKCCIMFTQIEKVILPWVEVA